MIQSVLATLAVVAAAIWLLRRIYLTVRAASRGDIDQLGRCGTCSHNPANEKAPVIELGVARSASTTQADIR